MNRYQLLINLFSIPIALYTLIIAIRNKDNRYLKQRLGFNIAIDTKDTKKDKVIWLHAASLGELNAATPLIKALSIKNNIIVTTNTPSSGKLANNVFSTSDSITHHYCPIDWRWTVRNFIIKNKPDYLFIIETELWPNLFTISHSKQIPITIINGRLSNKTLTASAWMLTRYKQCLQLTSLILSRSKEDTKRFKLLGAKPSNIQTIGNIKYHTTLVNNNIKPFSTITPYVLAASTRDDEEKIILAQWLKAQEKTTTNNLLIIVPRHPERLNKILQQLASFNINIAIRSKNDTITRETKVYIADTFGELVAFIKGAHFVMMGGSFVNKGGQNIIEVAQAGKTVVFGPYMDNFRDEAEQFINQQAGIQITKINTLHKTIETLLNQSEMNAKFKSNAIQLVHHNKKILENYLAAIQQQYPSLSLS